MNQEFDVGQLGKVLMIAGAGLFVFGLLVMLLSRTGLFRLPGDIIIGGEKWRFFLPITTCILISSVITLVAWLIRCFMNK